jgi:hypothetical protein
MTHELQRALGRIEGKLDGILERLEGHDARIVRVEGKVHFWSGVYAAVSGFLAIITNRVWQ